MSWFLLARVLIPLVAAASMTLMETEAGEPSVYYIQSSHGNFFMAPRMVINTEEASHVITKKVSDCSCKALCLSVITCKAWSVEKPQDGMPTCLLANEGPTNIIPVRNADATYFFREDSVSGTYSFQRGDKLLYVELNAKMNYDNGKKTCENIPGHRLMIVKTLVQYEYFSSLWETHIWSHVVVDLKKKIVNLAVKELVWGDGTTYNDTQLIEKYPRVDNGNFARVFVNFVGVFDDSVPNKMFTIICQANPLGVEW